MNTVSSKLSKLAPASDRITLYPYLAILAQLALAVWVIDRFEIESRAFLELTIYAACGFAVHALLPLRFRLPLFALLSLGSIVFVLGWASGAWVIGLGLALIGIAHLPLPLSARSALLVGAGLLLIMMRSGRIEMPFESVIWPILGSMFMFRIIVYVYDLQHEKVKPTLWRTLAYFFMLPNVCFPLYPVIDYKSFRRTYFDKDAYSIYQSGTNWIVRGLLHLIVYRAVSYYMVFSPGQVELAGDFALYALSTYLLYLRVSGTFHLIVGLLHLFGFNLAETHHLYYLATTVNDYWRRINIYWKDFMMKLFYYPAFFRLRRWSGTGALVISTGLVFLFTWVLHSYQWYWLRGAFPLLWQDAIFWGFLGIFVIFNALQESSKGRKRSLGREAWTWKRTAVTGAKAATMFFSICVLWSLWMSPDLGGWFQMWKRMLAAGSRNLPSMALILLSFAAYTAFAGLWLRIADKPAKAGLKSRPWFPALAAASTLGVLLVVTVPEVAAYFGEDKATTIAELQQLKLSRQDEEVLEQGYYEELVRIDRFNPRLWEVYSRKPAKWVGLRDTGAIETAGEFIGGELRPLQDFTFKGARLRTNRWGMRDRNYSKTVPEDTVRLAFLGASYTMGAGVGDNETYENIVEETMAAGVQGRNVEILNFGVSGYAATHQIEVLERKVLEFDPEIVVYNAHGNELTSLARHLSLVMRDSTEIPYPELAEMIEKTGVLPGQGRAQTEAPLRRISREVLRWAYERIASTCRENGITPVWLMIPRLSVDDRGSRFEPLRRIAEESGFLTIVIPDPYEGYHPRELHIARWDTHPNDIGHRLIAEKVVAGLRDLAPELGLEF